MFSSYKDKYADVIKWHYLYEPRLKTSDNIKYIWLYQNVKIRKKDRREMTANSSKTFRIWYRIQKFVCDVETLWIKWFGVRPELADKEVEVWIVVTKKMTIIGS